MNQTDHPTRFPIPFANGAGAGYIRAIPTPSQTPTSSDAPASLTDGFPPLTFSPEASGGIPPNGKDFNGILNQLSAGVRWFQAGGQAIFNSTFAAAIGGYPKGAVLASASTPGLMFVSTADGNTTDPDGASAANWSKIGAPVTQISGTSWKRVYPDGWTEMGGILTTLPSFEGAFTLTFPFSGFGSGPNANCLGLVGVIRNTTQSTSGQSTIQEVSLGTTSATLFVQNHQSNIADAAGGMRWKAWGTS